MGWASFSVDYLHIKIVWIKALAMVTSSHISNGMVGIQPLRIQKDALTACF